MRHLISRMCICHMKTGFAGVQFAALFPLIDRTLIKSASLETESISQSRVTCFIEYFSLTCAISDMNQISISN